MNTSSQLGKKLVSVNPKSNPPLSRNNRMILNYCFSYVSIILTKIGAKFFSSKEFFYLINHLQRNLVKSILSMDEK